MQSKQVLKYVFIGALCSLVLGGVVGRSSAAEPETAVPTRLACIGDSITFGAGVSDRETKAYPVLLGKWLGPKWEVRNFGASGSTLLKKGNLPYEKRPHFRQAKAFKPDVAILLFGANDSKHGAADNPKIADNWQYKADFVADYKALLAEFRQVNPKTKFYLGLPAPAFAPNRYGIDGMVIQNEIVPLVRQVATESGAEIIDLHSALNDKQLFRDRVHPNDAGTRQMADTTYRALIGHEPPADTEQAAVSAPITSALAPINGVATPAVKENFHIYLLMGQSNMVGRDTRTLNAQVDNPKVLALNGEGKWVVAREPMHVGGTGIPFATEMLKANPDATIGLVPCAVGGTSLGRWVKGADLYEKAVSRAKIAAPAGVIKGVLWHQGESDTTYEKKAEVYEKRVTGMFKDLRADLGQPNLPIVVGQLGEFLTTEKYPYVEILRAAINHIPEVTPHVGKASSVGLGDKGDKLHFSADAEKEMGIRFAQAMQQVQAGK